MIDEYAIRGALLDVTSGELPLQEFRTWLAQETWGVPVQELRKVPLVGQVELVLAEYDRGHVDDDELKDRLERLAGRVWSTDPEPFVTGSSNSSATSSPLIISASA